MPITLIHTSDIHLGAKFSFLGSNAGDQRLLLRNVFTSIVDQALSAKVDLLVIAGDLFDSPYPATVDVTHVVQQLGRLTEQDIRVAITPGNHDRLENGSVFAGDAFKSLEQNGNCKIFRNPAEVWEVEQLQTAVYGTGTKERVTKQSPLAKLAVKTELPNKVGVFHGSLDITKDDGNAPIKKEDLAKTGLDYVALGDWHSTLDVSSGGVTAWYSGSPEMLQSSQQGAGRILQVTIDDGKTSVKQLQSGKRKAYTHTIQLTSEVKAADIVAEVAKHAKPHDFVVLQMEGTIAPGAETDADAVVKLLEEQFFYVKVQDKSELQISEEVLQRYPETTITGRFIRNLQAKKTGDAEQDGLIDDAIQLGVRLLIKTDDI